MHASSTPRYVPIHIRSVNNTSRPICTLLARERISDPRRRNSLSDDRYSVKIARKDPTARLVSVYVGILYCSILPAELLVY